VIRIECRIAGAIQSNSTKDKQEGMSHKCSWGLCKTQFLLIHVLIDCLGTVNGGKGEKREERYERDT